MCVLKVMFVHLMWSFIMCVSCMNYIHTQKYYVRRVSRSYGNDKLSAMALSTGQKVSCVFLWVLHPCSLFIHSSIFSEKLVLAINPAIPAKSISIVFVIQPLWKHLTLAAMVALKVKPEKTESLSDINTIYSIVFEIKLKLKVKTIYWLHILPIFVFFLFASVVKDYLTHGQRRQSRKIMSHNFSRLCI